MYGLVGENCRAVVLDPLDAVAALARFVDGQRLLGHHAGGQDHLGPGSAQPPTPPSPTMRTSGRIMLSTPFQLAGNKQGLRTRGSQAQKG